MKKIIVFLLLALTLSCAQDEFPVDILGSEWTCNMTPQSMYEVKILAKFEFRTQHTVRYSESNDNGTTYELKWLAQYEVTGTNIELKLSPLLPDSEIINAVINNNSEMLIKLGVRDYKFLRQR